MFFQSTQCILIFRSSVTLAVLAVTVAYRGHQESQHLFLLIQVNVAAEMYLPLNAATKNKRIIAEKKLQTNHSR